MAKRRGALAKDPPLRGQERKEAQAKARGETPPPPKKDNPPKTGGSQSAPTKFKHAENQAAFDSLTPQQQAKWRKVNANKGRKAANELLAKMSGKPTVLPGQKPTGQQGPPPSPEQQFRDMSLGQQDREVYEDAGAFYNQMMGNAMKFDPNNPTAGYEQGFTNQLESARQNVMDQFERTMAPQFQREQAEFQQRMAEQGLDPNSGAYQAQYKAMADAQNAQRLNAQSQAFQLGAGYQQQGFEQGMQGQMLPFQQWQAAQDPWKLQFAARQEAELAEKNRQAQLQQARIGAGASVRAAQIGADASMHNANMNAINQGYPNQQQPSITNDIIRGGVAGATAGMMK